MITAISTIAKEEDDYLPFWLAWHLTAGFDKILVHSHDSVHECVNRIESVDTRVVHRRAVRTLHNRTLQEDTNMAGCEFSYGFADWVLCIDVDEFFFCPQFPVVNDYFAQIPEDVGQVLFNSQMFPASTNSDVSIPLVERCQYGAMQGHASGHIVKHALRPEALVTAGCHRSFIYEDFRTLQADLVTPSGNTLNDSYAEVIIWEPRIMHYPIKSDEEWERKTQRGYAWQGHVRQVSNKLQTYHPGTTLDFVGGKALDLAFRAKVLMKTWGF